MELFAKLFSSLLVFVYHCFDRIVIHGYLSGLSRPEQVIHLFRQVLGAALVSEEVLSQLRTQCRGDSKSKTHMRPPIAALLWIGRAHRATRAKILFLQCGAILESRVSAS